MKFSIFKTKIDTILPAIATAFILGILLFQVGATFVKNPQLALTWDWPGHLDKAAKLDWPWKSGWDNTFFAGHTTLTYPSFSHLILKILLWIFQGNRDVTVIVASSLVILLQLVGIYKVVLVYVPKKIRLQGAAFLAFISFFYTIDGSQLGGFQSNLLTGGFAAAIGIILFLFFIGTTNPYIQAVLFGLILLTHPLTAVLIGLILGVKFAIHIISIVTAKTKVPLLNKSHLIPLFGGLAIGSPWWLVLLDPAFKSTAINLDGSYQYLFFALVVVLFVVALEKKISLTLPWVGLIVATALIGLPKPAIHWLQSHLINGIHFYRFYLFAGIFATTCLISLFSKTVKRDLAFPSMLLVASACFVALLTPLSKRATTIIENYPSAVNSISGRTMDVSGIEFTGNFPRAPEYILAQLPARPGSAGLFYESSQTGIQFYTLAKSINPKYFANGTTTFLFEDLATKSATVSPVELADLLGISNISYIATDDKINITNVPIATVGAMLRIDKFGQVYDTVPWRIAQMKPSPLITPLASLPHIDPNIDLGMWWLDTDRKKLITKEPYPSETKPDASAKIKDIVIDTNRIKFYVDSERPVPVFIKFTHNRYWRNLSNPTNQPQWVTPGFMTLLAQGETELVWRPPTYVTLGYIVSVLTILLLVIQMLKSKKTRPVKSG